MVGELLYGGLDVETIIEERLAAEVEALPQPRNTKGVLFFASSLVVIFVVVCMSRAVVLVLC